MAKRILVVDDDLYIREIYEEVLKHAGYEVESGRDGEEGLAKLQQGGYDVILLDMLMPKLNGIAILEAITANPPQTKNGPIIFLTNATDDPLLEKAKTMGIKESLVKSDITPQDLVEYVKKIIAPN